MSVNPNRDEYRDADFVIKSAAGACKWQFVLSNRVIGRGSEQFWGSLNAVTDEITVESCRDRRAPSRARRPEPDLARSHPELACSNVAAPYALWPTRELRPILVETRQLGDLACRPRLTKEWSLISRRSCVVRRAKAPWHGQPHNVPVFRS